MIKDLNQVAAYLDGIIVFDSNPIEHVQTIRSLFKRLRKANLRFSPSKARLGATDANFLGHSISPAGLRRNEEKVSALVNMPMPTDVKQVRALVDGINYYRNFLPDLSKRLRPINSLRGMEMIGQRTVSRGFSALGTSSSGEATTGCTPSFRSTIKTAPVCLSLIHI